MTDEELNRLRDDYDWFTFKRDEFTKRAKDVLKRIKSEEETRNNREMCKL